jgi:hypothetical protein
MSHFVIDAYILETLMPDLVGHDRQPSAFLVYLFLWTSAYAPHGATARPRRPAYAKATAVRRSASREGGSSLGRSASEGGQTHGRKEATTQVALRDIAEGTGLSKRSVQDALGRLSKRKLITVERESITAVPVYTVLRPWRR